MAAGARARTTAKPRRPVFGVRGSVHIVTYAWQRHVPIVPPRDTYSVRLCVDEAVAALPLNAPDSLVDHAACAAVASNVHVRFLVDCVAHHVARKLRSRRALFIALACANGRSYAPVVGHMLRQQIGRLAVGVGVTLAHLADPLTPPPPPA